MRSVLLVTLEYPPQIGGIAEYLSCVTEALGPDRIHILAPEVPEAHDTDMAAGAPIYRRRLSSRFLRPRWLPAVYWTWWLCRKERPQALVISHVLPMGHVAWLMRRFLGIPYVVILHGMDIASAVAAQGRKRRETGRILSAAALVVANSGYTAQWVRSLGIGEDRIAVVKPAPSLLLPQQVAEGDADSFRDRHGLGGRFMLLFVGRLVRRKGADIIIRVLPVLKDRGIDAGLVVVGDGPERPALEALAEELGVSDRVSFPGPLQGRDLAAAYAAADVFVMTPQSRGPDVEGFGIVYLEANLFGKPVIGSRSGGVPDAVRDGETGLLVEAGRPEDLAEAVGRLHRDPGLRERLGSRGQRRVRAEFGDNRQAKRFVAVLDSIIGHRDDC